MILARAGNGLRRKAKKGFPHGEGPEGGGGAPLPGPPGRGEGTGLSGTGIRGSRGPFGVKKDNPRKGKKSKNKPKGYHSLKKPPKTLGKNKKIKKMVIEMAPESPQGPE
jgi:hypothetical protein